MQLATKRQIETIQVGIMGIRDVELEDFTFVGFRDDEGRLLIP